VLAQLEQSLCSLRSGSAY